MGSLFFVLAAAAGPAVVEVPGGTIDVMIEAQPSGLTRAQVLAWVEGSARAVAAYYGSFPVPRVRLRIHSGWRGRVGGGRTQGGPDGASIDISLGSATAESDLDGDWELVHEMVHLAFPSMRHRQAWIEEGLATYVEPIARARAGCGKGEDIWRWLTWGLPQGSSAVEHSGLDTARGRAATYWGGALFCFLADVEIRKETDNRKSLDDALRAIVKAGGNVNVEWDLSRVLAVGDKAVGAAVLTKLRARMGEQPMTVDVKAILKSLGVSGDRSGVTFDDTAPLSAIRRGIQTGAL